MAFVHDLQKHTQAILVSGEYVHCSETNARDLSIAFLAKLCCVYKCQHVRNESHRIFMHIYYLSPYRFSPAKLSGSVSSA
jgi:hypothetical protein